jgi:hypothetical protein
LKCRKLAAKTAGSDARRFFCPIENEFLLKQLEPLPGNLTRRDLQRRE